MTKKKEKNNQEIKQKKEKKHIFKNWIKEIKRIKWPTTKVAKNNYLLTLLFVIVCSLLFLAITVLVTYIWKQMGVGF
ncbi:preprotein translocase subunit SecE [Mycoplasma procyoni]|uniref:preprotein translocase subunit SecE n=1 Tax=Mycoplasma procyoni TaxID=568784 RepID=UPI00197B5285|nr:preprotein translocase subunit SecE [Mycoplasma procyoni]MBN3534846.1 preprotein translocase subunit SecE [Mycoplasma procyoni]